MSGVGNWIRVWREHMGLTRDDVAREAGVSLSTVVRVETSGGTQKRSTLLAIAKAIGLRGPAAFALAEWAAGDIDQQAFDARVTTRPVDGSTVTLGGKEFLVTPGAGAPILGEITAGGMIESIVYDNGDEPERLPIAYPERDRVYALRIRGDSMAPVYRPGEYLIVQDATREELQDGEDAVIQCDGGADGCSTFKRVVFLGNGNVRLLPLNSLHEPQEIRFDHIVRIGKVLGTYRPNVVAQRVPR